MKIIEDTISLEELSQMAESTFGGLVKAVVDIKKEIMVVDAELHADQESRLLELGSRQEDLWGINFYPEHYGSENFVEFDSMINLRPRQGNTTRGVEDDSTRKFIRDLLAKMVKKS